MSKIKGIYAASMSIFNSDLSLNIEKTVIHAEQIIDKGCHGVAIFGSTGQAQLISISEKINLLNKLSKLICLLNCQKYRRPVCWIPFDQL